MPIARTFAIDQSGALRQVWTCDPSAQGGYPAWMDADDRDMASGSVDLAKSSSFDIEARAGRYAMALAILAMGCISILQLHLA